jgi:hypothetical protein
VPLGVVGLVQLECLAPRGRLDFIAQSSLNHVLQGLSAPVREDIFAQFLDLSSGDVEWILRARGQHVQLPVNPIDRTFRSNHAHARLVRPVANNHLIRVDRDGRVSHEMKQHLGAPHRHGLALSLTIRFGG